MENSLPFLISADRLFLLKKARQIINRCCNVVIHQFDDQFLFASGQRVKDRAEKEQRAGATKY
ncbi:hypothetical protein [Pseudomonas putida]